MNPVPTIEPIRWVDRRAVEEINQHLDGRELLLQDFRFAAYRASDGGASKATLRGILEDVLGEINGR